MRITTALVIDVRLAVPIMETLVFEDMVVFNAWNPVYSAQASSPIL